MLRKLNLEIDERRVAIAMIVAGWFYLIACNSVLLYLDDRWYFGAILLGPVICLPFVLTTRAAPQQRRTEAASWHVPGAIPTSTVSHELAVPVEDLDALLLKPSSQDGLSRNGLSEKHRERPVFLWSDEAQETVNSYDAEFLSMCRGSKCCVTYPPDN